MISSSEIIGNSIELLTSALSAVAHDKINEIKIDGITTWGNNVKLLALEILNLNNGSRDDFAQQLAEFLFQLLNDYDISRSSEREALFKSFHRYISRMEIAKDEWEKLISFCAVTSEDGFRFSYSLYQNIATEVLTQMIKYLNLKHKAKQTSQNLTKEEKEILAYVSGYVVLALHRKYCRILKTGKNNIIATAVLQVFDTFKVSGGDSLSSENFNEYRNS